MKVRSTMLCALVAAAAVAASSLGAEQQKEDATGHRSRIVGKCSLPAILSPGTSFRECPNFPEMVVIPSGRFEMGVTKEEHDTSLWESGTPAHPWPAHPVYIKRSFAIGKYLVTFEEWDACVAEGGCGGYLPSDEGWGRGRHPVINVNWTDVSQYIKWMNSKVLKKKRGSGPYRLPSESEWEYAARAGTNSARWWGGEEARMNYAICSDCGDAVWSQFGTAPVGTAPPNPFGLYDMLGNVDEWIEDCSNTNYDMTPNDGRPYISTSCMGHVLRGGNWTNQMITIRSSTRYAASSSHRGDWLGFRVARDID